MTANDASSTPLSEETVYVAFLKDLAAADPEQVIRDYAARYPHLAHELRDVARLQRKLDDAKALEPPKPEQPAQLGDFRIIRPIAEGGMGTIYLATQEPLGRRVAVKTIRSPSSHLTGTLQARFLREQKVLAQLHHTHIVPIHAAGNDGTLQYFAMSYIDGAALHHVVRTAWLHESSSDNNRIHKPTPTLGALAAAARSSTPNAGTQVPNGSHRDGQPPLAAVPSTTTLANVDAPRYDPQAAEGPPGSPPQHGNGKLILSPEYFRSVARVMLDAAEAVQHAHDARIIHRDLKPSNLMVDTAEHCWVLDFGLAGYLREQANGHIPTADSSHVGSTHDLGPDPEQLSSSGILGTPDYMAPEQLLDRADARTDVWGLGITLYELLTLRRAFHGRKQIESADPTRPRDLVNALPLDLEAICWKAIRKESHQRYPSARALADDLRHWLKSEPVQARPAHTLRRVLLWVKRNKGWAAAIALATLAFAAVSTAAIYVSKTRADAARAVAVVAREKQHEAEDRAAAEHRVTLTQRRELLIQQMQRIRLTHRRQKWSRNAWDLLGQAAEIEKDARIQSQAAAMLSGLDLRPRKAFGLPGTGLAFDPTGKRLLVSGSSQIMRGPELPVQIWDRTTDLLQTTKINGEGVFGFRPDGSSVLAMVPRKKPLTLQIWDVAKEQILRTFESPLKGNTRIQSITMTPDGSTVAALCGSLDEKGSVGETGMIVVWETTSGREIMKTDLPRGTELALAPDANLLAGGKDSGEILLWSLPNKEPISTLKAGRNRISCLAFGRDPVRRATQQAGDINWLLAAGDQGGGVIIWDLQRRIPRSIGHGPAESAQLVFVVFSPDGMTLASAGRGSVQLWDIASGQSLLSVDGGNYTTALAFSPDGRHLAVGSIAAFGYPDNVVVWDVEPGRGIDEFRGLRGAIIRSVFSLDGRMVGALSNDWNLGIWDRTTRRLLHILEITPGFHQDNAALAFSPDGQRFAFSSGGEASLWDMTTGKPTRTWKLPPGLVDLMAFSEENRLLLFRTETKNAEVGPFGAIDPVAHPRVCRIRNLLGVEPLKPIGEIHDCNLHVFGAHCSLDGKYYVVDGLGGAPGKVARIATIYDGATGQTIGALPRENLPERNYAALAFDTTGTVLGFQSRKLGDPCLLLELPTRAVLRQFEVMPSSMGPRATRWLRASDATSDQPTAFTLFQQDQAKPLISFVVDLGDASVGNDPKFSPDGLHLAWGNSNGTVTVVDLVEVQRRLAEFGLGW
jgi:eukaryotic-like serine/threonine-protein kinase